MEENQKKGKLHKKGKLLFPVLSWVLAAVTLVTASYAWISISRTPIVSDLQLNVITDNRLELAMDNNGVPGEWDVVLDMSTVLNDIEPLRTTTYSNRDGRFYAMRYGIDGRPDVANEPLTDERNANVKANASTGGYYIAVTFWMRSQTTADVALSEAKEVEEGRSGSGTYVIGTPVWDSGTLSHTNGGKGLETAVRIGFKCQTTDKEGNLLGEERFVIYEPNADIHIVEPDGYIKTASINGSDSLIPEGNLIWQTASSWRETAPVLNDQVIYQLGTFRTEPYLFQVTTETMQKITMYIWIEGQDVDCMNAAAGTYTSLLANIQFTPIEGYVNTGIKRD